MKKIITGMIASAVVLSMAFPALASTRACDRYEACAVEGCETAACHEHDGVIYRGTCQDGTCSYHSETCGTESGSRSDTTEIMGTMEATAVIDRRDNE